MKSFSDISKHFPVENGFCYPDWNTICDHVETAIPKSEWEKSWEFITQQWLKKNRDRLGGEYQIYETPNFLILSEASKRIIKDACRSYEEALKLILKNLEGAVLDEGDGKHVVIMFSQLDDYYDYIMHFYPEGEHPMSGGICINKGFIHFAFPTVNYSSYRSVLVHELTHGCLGHLPIPAWLNEALAMRMEEVICGTDIFLLDQEIYDKHSHHWNEETIQLFWSGKSWDIQGDSFELSYNLAQILWRKIEGDLRASKESMVDFITSAHANDAGEQAFQSLFEISLGDLVADFLGEGNWEPNPKKWINDAVAD